MNLQVGMASLLCAILPSMALVLRGTDPLRLVPAAADAVARVENPRALYNAVYEHELFQDFLKIDTVAAFYDTTNFRQRCNSCVAFLEKELGHSRLDARCSIERGSRERRQYGCRPVRTEGSPAGRGGQG